MANETRSINLLPGKDGGFLSQFLGWALTIGRLLIILVETLALGTFLYRFGLDMKIVDLHDQIKAQSTIVQNFAVQEESFRNLQARLALAKNYGETNKTPVIFQDIVEMGRGKITFRNLLVARDSLKIEAEAPNGSRLARFTEALKNHPDITEVSVDKVETKTSTATVIVIISGKVRTYPNAAPPDIPEKKDPLAPGNVANDSQ
jgi:hypothetical protein